MPAHSPPPKSKKKIKLIDTQIAQKTAQEMYITSNTPT